MYGYMAITILREFKCEQQENMSDFFEYKYNVCHNFVIDDRKGACISRGSFSGHRVLQRIISSHQNVFLGGKITQKYNYSNELKIAT